MRIKKIETRGNYVSVIPFPCMAEKATTSFSSPIPVFVLYLSHLITLIAKAEASARKRGFDATVLMEARLAPDMYPFVKQVQYAYFMAFETASRISGVPYPQFAYDEKTPADLKVSLNSAITFLKDKKLTAVLGPTTKVESFVLAPKKKIALAQYVNEVAIPNFFFHYTTAYDILRHNGVPVGKDDYLGI